LRHAANVEANYVSRSDPGCGAMIRVAIICAASGTRSARDTDLPSGRASVDGESATFFG
jgi:hypothetical protein